MEKSDCYLVLQILKVPQFGGKQLCCFYFISSLSLEQLLNNVFSCNNLRTYLFTKHDIVTMTILFLSID